MSKSSESLKIECYGSLESENTGCEKGLKPKSPDGKGIMVAARSMKPGHSPDTDQTLTKQQERSVAVVLVM